MMRGIAVALAGLIALLALETGAAAQDEAMPPLPKQQWSFAGPFGTFDRAAVQRGFGVYNEVCSKCHSLSLVHYGDLGPDGPGGGLGYSDDAVKAFAATQQVADTDAQGQPAQRPGQPTDAPAASLYANEKQAKATFNGAVPPDLSVIINAREGGADYIYALLSGYKDNPPTGFQLTDGTFYNEYFPGHRIAMPAPPLQGNDVPGVEATADQERRDVVTFLAWAAEPTMEDRKRTGVKVLIFLVVTTAFLYLAKRQIWADLH